MQRLFKGAASDGSLLVELASKLPAGLDPEGREVPERMRRRYIPPATFAEAIESLRGQTDIYFGPALRKAAEPTKEAVAKGRVIWVDYDEPEYPDPEPLLPPSLTILTGNGWHLYWLLSVYVTPDKLEYLNKTIVEASPALSRFSDDCWNSNRILRVPGTIHSATGKTIQVIDATFREYEPTDVERLLNISDKTRRKILTGSSRGYRSRSERDFAVVKDLILAGISHRGIGHIFAEHLVGDKLREHPKPASYLKRTIDAAEEEGKKSPGGIEKRPDGYYKGGQYPSRLSTFTLEPTLLLEGTLQDAIQCSITAREHTWPDIQLPKDAFNSVRNLQQYLPKAAWQWLGGDTTVRALLPLLMAELHDKGLPKVTAVECVGRHGDYFVLPSGTLSADRWWPHPTGPVVYLGRTGIDTPDLDLVRQGQPGSTNQGTHNQVTQEDICRILATLVRVNEPPVLFPLLGWWMATPLKTEIERMGYRFPLASVFGTRGSGKTTTITEVLMRLFAYQRRMTFDSTTTRFVLLSLLGSSNSLPIALSEFRQGSVREHLMRYVLLSYDMGHDPRGRPDRTVEDFPLSAPFTMDGEDMLSEPAGRERMIGVRLRPEYIKEGGEHYEAFTRLQSERLEDLALPYLQFTLRTDVRGLLEEASSRFNDAFPESLPHRVRRNFTVVTAGLILTEAFCPDGLPQLRLRDTLGESLSFSYDTTKGRGRLHVDDFVEAMVSAVERGTSSFYWKVEGTVVWMQLGPALNWWKKEVRRWGSESLGRDAITSQLEEVSYSVEPQTMDGRWCYGIDTTKAMQVGLDVPEQLSVTELRINL